MIFEVEQKYRVDDPQRVERTLASLGVALSPAVHQVDRYFNHPSRDFAQTDEALRIRSTGSRNRITYKGAKIDSTTKTRAELELPLADGSEAALAYCELLEVLDFKPVPEVRKRRRTGTLDWQGDPIEISLDDVAEVGSFVELEQTVTEAELDRARRQLAELAERLELHDAERRSYLELLLASRQASKVEKETPSS
jgi:adenylate cyclase class 2